MLKHFFTTVPLLVLGVLAAPHDFELEERQAQSCTAVSTMTVTTPTTVYLPTTVYQEARAVRTTTSKKSSSSSTTKKATTTTAKKTTSTTKKSTSTKKATSTSKKTTSTTKKSTTSTSSSKKLTSTTKKSTATTSKRTTSSSTSRTSSTRTTTSTSSSTTVAGSTVNGRRNVLYFTNWGIYGSDYQPQEIPADKVTHLLYSFANIASDGTVESSDTYADLEKHYSTDSWNDSGTNAYGCVKQLYILKKKYRKFKTILSIGGWTYSSKFAPVAATAAGRAQFASSAVKLVTDWGFDGIDIDWEYPADSTEAANFVLLLKAVRAALDSYSKANSLNYRFLITVATAAGPSNYNIMDLAGMNKYVDAWHLMAYDYAGSWSTVTGHQANLYYSSSNPSVTPFNTHQAVTAYLAAGIASSKVVLGMPLYGRSFAGTDGLGKSFTGVGGGTVQQGIWSYKDLPRPGATVTFDKKVGAVYSYSSSSQEFVSYDNAQSVKFKTSYLLRHSLGGALYWEASMDKNGTESLVRTVANTMGGLDTSYNLLNYPTSQYDNIKNNMSS